jgi:hypothetical protein
MQDFDCVKEPHGSGVMPKVQLMDKRDNRTHLTGPYTVNGKAQKFPTLDGSHPLAQMGRDFLPTAQNVHPGCFSIHLGHGTYFLANFVQWLEAR